MLQVQRPQSSTSCRGWQGSPILAALGFALDTRVTCNVYEGGFVWPAPELLPEHLAGMLQGVIGHGDDQDRQAGPAGRGQEGQRQAGEAAARTAAAGAGASLLGDVALVVPMLSEALLAYPQLQVSSVSASASHAAGLRLSVTVQPIADLPTTATIAVYWPAEPHLEVMSWAWWEDGIWIGPRHTYANGSICSFEKRDRTWTRAHGPRPLMDLNVVWVARQMYLRAYGRWPGQQRIHTSLGRLLEQAPDELCGCGSAQAYHNCHCEDDTNTVATAEIERHLASRYFERRMVP